MKEEKPKKMTENLERKERRKAIEKEMKRED